MAAKNIPTAVADVLRRCGLTEVTLVVAVSGGPDSVALLLALCGLRDELALNLRVAHFDHHLRDDSREDVQFVRELARSLNLALSVGNADVRQLAQQSRRGIEEAARDARYTFFARVVDESGARAALTGHTADDQFETRLLHAVRGSGLAGLAGMSEDGIIGLPSGGRLRVVRPLLGIPRDDVEAYCRARGVVPRRDPTNADRRFARNRLRHAVTPELRAINPAVQQSFERLARVAGDADRFIEDELDRRLRDLVRVSAETWVIDRVHWRLLPVALQRACLRRAARALGREESMYAEPIEAALAMASAAKSGGQVAWPGGSTVRVEHDAITISRRHPARYQVLVRNFDTDSAQTIDLGVLPPSLLRARGTTEESVGRRGALRVHPVERTCHRSAVDRWHVDLERATLGASGRLNMRGRRPGDWLCPEGLGGRKKVQDVLVDAYIPREEREGVPIVESDQGIAWLVGVRRDERHLATPDSRDVLCLSVDLS